jgi:hypothetical protein
MHLTPSTLYTRSTQAFASRMKPIEYPSGFDVRRVAESGRVRWKSAFVTIGHALEGELVGIEPSMGCTMCNRDAVSVSEQRGINRNAPRGGNSTANMHKR